MKYEILRSKKFKTNYKKLDSQAKDEVLNVLKRLANDEILELKRPSANRVFERF